MPDVMIVVPTYNEVEGLERTVGRLRQSVPHAELVIIDDGSPDGTGALADRLSKADAGTLVIHRTERGYRSAVIEGIRFAMSRGATKVVITDADGSYDADGLPELLAVSASGVDLVIGSRFVEGSDVRNMGLVGGVELEARPGMPGARGFETFLRCFDKGVLVRSTGDILAIAPALIVEDSHIDQIVSTLREVLGGIE